jgi:hypothetical protein
MRFFRLIVPAAVLAALAFANTASAQCGGYGVGNCWFGNLNAYGSSGTLYGSGYLPVPPYFAVHPPVYYSHPYYRPYGWSPFAQPGWAAPVALRPTPVAVANPYVPKFKVEPREAAEEKNNTAKAVMIENPYFVAKQPTGQGRLAGLPTQP